MDADALSHIPWEDHGQHSEAEMVQTLISNVTQGTTLIEAYSCNMPQVTENWTCIMIQKPYNQKD